MTVQDLRNYLSSINGDYLTRLKPFLIFASANAFTRGVSILFPFLLIQLLGAYAYGQYSLSMNTILMISNFFALPITAATSKYLAQHERGDQYSEMFDELVTKIMFLIIAVFTLVLIFFLNVQFFNTSLGEQKYVLLLGVLYIPLNLLVSLLTGMKYVHKGYYQLSLSLIGSIIAQLVSFYVLTSFFGIKGAIFSFTVLSITQLLILKASEPLLSIRFVLHRIQRFLRKKEWNRTHILRGFILPNMLSAMIVPIVVWKSNLFIVERFGYENLGFINICLQAQVIIGFLPSILNSMILPKLSRSFHSDRKQYMADIKKLLLVTTLIVGVISGLMILFAKPILLLYSPDFAQHSDSLQLFCVAFFISQIANVSGQIILSSGSLWWGVILNIVWSVVFFSFLYSLADRLALNVIPYAYIGSYIIHFLLVFIYIGQFLYKNNNYE